MQIAHYFKKKKKANCPRKTIQSKIVKYLFMSLYFHYILHFRYDDHKT